MSLATQNAFAALQQSKKTKKPGKTEGEKRKSKGSNAGDVAAIEQALFNQPTVGITSWADEDDFDDDHDDEWTQARPGTSNGIPAFQTAPEHDDSPLESEEDEEEVCSITIVHRATTHTESVQEEHEHVDLEVELGVEFAKDDEEEDTHHDEPAPSPAAQPIPAQPIKPLEPERMLSKKEKKQKELDELNAALAELGIDLPESVPEEAPAAGKKKKKAKVANGADKATENQEPATNGAAGRADTGGSQEEEEEEGPVQLVDPAEARKAVAAKKKAAGAPSKGAAAAKAAAEAKARAKKLAAKKDKSHYNQVR